MLRATLTRKPARSISISVRLVSSSSNASSRMSALSSLLSFAAVLSSGWRAMSLIRNFLFGDGTDASGFGLDADPGGKAIDREPVTVDAEAAKRRESGAGGEGVMTEILAGGNSAEVQRHGQNFQRHYSDRQRDRGVRIAGGSDDNFGRLPGRRLVDEIEQ